MSNKVFTTYKAPVNSFPLGEMNLGLMKPGRYNGFSEMVSEIGLQVRIKHTGSVRKASQSLEDTIEYNRFGCILTPNGSVIHNEADVDGEGILLTIGNNTGNSNTRYDLVVCEHEYIEVTGGQPPSFFIQQGNLDGDIPELANPEKQVIVGIIAIQPNGHLFSHLTYTPSPVPFAGDMDAQDFVNQIAAIIAVPDATTVVKGKARLATTSEAAARVLDNVILTPVVMLYMTANTTQVGLVRKATDQEIVSNSFVGTDPRYVSPDQMRKYGRLNDFIKHDTNSITLNNDWNGRRVILDGDGGATPLITFTVPPLGVNQLANNFSVKFICKTQKVQFQASSGITIDLPSDKNPRARKVTSVVELHCVNVDSDIFILEGDLEIKPLGSGISTGLVPKLSALPYFPTGNFLTEFDATGLGLDGTEVQGWAICNGQNGTRDLRGKFLAGRDPGNALFDTCGKTGGYANTVLPDHLHDSVLYNMGKNAVNEAGTGATELGWQIAGDYGTAQVAQTGKPIKIDGSNALVNPLGEDGVNKNYPPFYTTIYIQRIN